MLQTSVTAEELYAMPDDGFRYELVRGELVKMPPAGFIHGRLGQKVGTRMDQYATRMRLGLVAGSETGYQLAEDHVLSPDVSFVSESRIPVSGPPEGYFSGAPDLAVEVISPSERQRRIDEKIEDYLNHGCRMVVLVLPRERRFEVHTPDGVLQVLEVGDVLDGGDVVPGWQLPIADIFDDE